jgi:hypothetical protein
MACSKYWTHQWRANPGGILSIGSIIGPEGWEFFKKFSVSGEIKKRLECKIRKIILKINVYSEIFF